MLCYFVGTFEGWGEGGGTGCFGGWSAAAPALVRNAAQGNCLCCLLVMFVRLERWMHDFHFENSANLLPFLGPRLRKAFFEGAGASV